MARGTMPFFDGDRLRHVRETHTVDGKVLTTTEVAEALGTSRSRIHAYEQGASKPEASRVRELAELFGVRPEYFTSPTWSLDVRQKTQQAHLTLQELRFAAGLTAAQTAAQLGISRTTYREIENEAVLPPRHDGSLPLKIASAFDRSVQDIYLALDFHPKARQRRVELSNHLKNMFRRVSAGEQVFEDGFEDPHLVAISGLLRRSLAVTYRLVNNEAETYRGLLRARALAEVEARYLQREREKELYVRRVEQLTQNIKTASLRSARSLTRFLAQAMTSRQWRALNTLMASGGETTLAKTPQDDPCEVEAWSALIERGLVDLDEQSDDWVTYSLSIEGRHLFRRQADTVIRYTCLYPRIQTLVFPNNQDMPSSIRRRQQLLRDQPTAARLLY